MNRCCCCSIRYPESKLLLTYLLAYIFTRLGSQPQSNESSGEWCLFNDTIINSKTISNFPTGDDFCYRVDGSIRIDETTDLTHEQLVNALGRLEVLTGTLEVVNTAYTNLSFFSSLFIIFSIYYGEFGYELIILNNSKMETMAGGAQLTVVGTVRIENNPLLDPNCAHVLQYYNVYRRIRGNRNNCGCELDYALTNENIEDVQDNCAAIFGPLYLFGPNVPSAEALMRKFGQATYINGEIAVLNTNYTDLCFLQNLTRAELYYSREGANTLERFIRVENNKVLTKLCWSNLKIINGLSIQFDYNPNLCFTILELEGLFSSYHVKRAGGRVCEELGSNEALEHVCRIGNTASLESIPGDCYTLVGHLIVDHNSPKEQFWKLYNVTQIYGSLTIRNTSLTGLSPFWRLANIYNLEANSSALVIESNSRLKSMYMSGVARFVSDVPIRISDSPVLMMSPGECVSLLRSTARVDFYDNKYDCLEQAKLANAIRIYFWTPIVVLFAHLLKYCYC